MQRTQDGRAAAPPPQPQRASLDQGIDGFGSSSPAREGPGAPGAERANPVTPEPRDKKKVHTRPGLRCAIPGCTNDDEYNMITLQMGLPHCFQHASVERSLDARAAILREEGARPEDASVFFYAVETDYPVDQDRLLRISAVCIDKSVQPFDLVVAKKSEPGAAGTGRKRPRSSVDDVFSPHEGVAFFFTWLRGVHAARYQGDPAAAGDANIALVAHGGASLHHRALLNVVQESGADVPNFQLVDSLVIFKLLRKPRRSAKLPDLWNAWRAQQHQKQQLQQAAAADQSQPDGQDP